MAVLALEISFKLVRIALELFLKQVRIALELFLKQVRVALELFFKQVRIGFELFFEQVRVALELFFKQVRISLNAFKQERINLNGVWLVRASLVVIWRLTRSYALLCWALSFLKFDALMIAAWRALTSKPWIMRSHSERPRNLLIIYRRVLLFDRCPWLCYLPDLIRTKPVGNCRLLSIGLSITVDVYAVLVIKFLADCSLLVMGIMFFTKVLFLFCGFWTQSVIKWAVCMTVVVVFKVIEILQVLLLHFCSNLVKSVAQVILATWS